jgi:threonine/homoserine/homoserine lactone efflux protein
MSTAMVGFLGLCLVMTLTPGLDTAMVMRNALRRGPGAGVLTAVGCALGLFVHAAAVALGLAAILLKSAMVFEVVRWIGAVVLVVIGALSLRAAITGRGVSAPDLDAETVRTSRRSSFAQGLLTNLTNPKATLFFLSALPQFVNAGSSAQALPQAMSLAVIAATFSAVGLSLVGLLAGRARRWLSSVRTHRILEGVMGTVLVGLGIRVALDHP